MTFAMPFVLYPGESVPKRRAILPHVFIDAKSSIKAHHLPFYIGYCEEKKMEEYLVDVQSFGRRHPEVWIVEYFSIEEEEI